MDKDYKLRLRANIWKLYVFRAFTKRSFLPLIAVYSIQIAGLSLPQLGIVVGISSAISLIMEIPGGYFADKMGHKQALIFGAFFLTISPLFYVLIPTFIGMTLASGFFFFGYAFHSGTLQAFMHETLIELDMEDQFAKTQARGTMWGLIGNIFLLALVPLTYTIDAKLPFIIGSLLISVVFFLCLTLENPLKAKEGIVELKTITIKNLFKSLKINNNYILFLLLGLVATVFDKVPSFREIYFQAVNIPVSYFGITLAFGSLVGVAISFYIVKLSKLPPVKFYFIDAILSVFLVILIGLNTNAIFGVILFTILVAYDRNRDAIVHNFILAESPTRALKATYLSLLAFLADIFGIFLPILLGYFIGKLGIFHGYFYYGVIMGVFVLFFYTWYFFKKSTSN